MTLHDHTTHTNVYGRHGKRFRETHIAFLVTEYGTTTQPTVAVYWDIRYEGAINRKLMMGRWKFEKGWSFIV